MDREFLDLYNRELQVLYDYAEDFAQDYPGIAERLGGLLRDRQDPMIGGLLEGAAFMAARVQLKLKHEHFEFLANYLEQVVPHYLAPTPSVALVRVEPPFGESALRDGIRIEGGAYLDAIFRERDTRVACRYQIRGPVTLWPLEVAEASYLSGPGAVQALGVSAGPGVAAGLRLTLRRRTAAQTEEEPSDEACEERPETWLSEVKLDRLPIRLLGPEADVVAAYEQLTGRLAGVTFRMTNAKGDVTLVPAPPDCVAPVGFSTSETLVPRSTRVFHGFDLLRDYFLFPQTFLGIQLEGLSRIVRRLKARTVDVVFTFSETSSRLQTSVDADMFSLHTVPCVNLFEKRMDRVALGPTEHEHLVVPDRGRYREFEVARIGEVYAHFRGGESKVPVVPLYGASSPEGGATDSLHYTTRRLPRRRTQREREFGEASSYAGDDVFISLVEAADREGEPVSQLSMTALCTNRHLTEQLPVGEGGADFRFLEDTTLDVTCVAGPTAPTGPVVAYPRGRKSGEHKGSVAWRLVNMLSLNHLSLASEAAGADARGLKEVLSMFADPAQAIHARRIRGLKSVSSRPIVRRVRRREGIGVARGLEITVEVDEGAFEGSGAFLLGAVLHRFFCEYVAINHFVETVLRSRERGEIMRWAPRPGERTAL